MAETTPNEAAPSETTSGRSRSCGSGFLGAAMLIGLLMTFTSTTEDYRVDATCEAGQPALSKPRIVRGGTFERSVGTSILTCPDVLGGKVKRARLTDQTELNSESPLEIRVRHNNGLISYVFGPEPAVNRNKKGDYVVQVDHIDEMDARDWLQS